MTPRPSDLPEWTKKEQFTDRNWGVQMDKYHTALSIAWEALEAIRRHQKILMNDSGLVMSTTYTISNRAISKIEALGGKEKA